MLNWPDQVSSGSAYVFTRTAGIWVEQQKLTASDAATSDRFGLSIAAHGDTVAVGARCNDDDSTNRGAVYIFQRSGDVWAEAQKLQSSDADDFDLFGASLALEDATMITLTHGDGSRPEQQRLIAADISGHANYGTSVAISGESAVVGAFTGAGGGSVYVFCRSRTGWVPE